MRRGRYFPPRLRRCKDRGEAAAGRLFLYAGEGKSVQGSAELGHRAPLSRSRGKYSSNMLLAVPRCALSRKDARIATRDLSPIRFRGVKTRGMECLSPSGLRIYPRDLSPSRAFVFSGRRAPLIRERFLTRYAKARKSPRFSPLTLFSFLSPREDRVAKRKRQDVDCSVEISRELFSSRMIASRDQLDARHATIGWE